MNRLLGFALLLVVSSAMFVGCNKGTETKATTPAKTETKTPEAAK